MTTPPAETVVPAGVLACPSCGEPAGAGDTFCEACGAPLGASAGASAGLEGPPVGEMVSVLAATGPVVATGPVAAEACERCGAAMDPDGFCTGCGMRRARHSDHIEMDLGAIAFVSDKGLHHHRNEDSAAVKLNGSRAVGVVCDGVSSSANPDRAAQAAASAAISVLSEVIAAASAADPIDVVAALGSAVGAARRAAAAVTVTEATTPSAAPSTTLVASVVVPGVVAVANIGDSRAYWLESGQVRQLSVDDSWAEAAIAAGMSAADAYRSERAHMITRWLGADSDEAPATTTTLSVDGEGLLVLCSDGLWNYFPSPQDLARLVDRIGPAAPVELARRLVDAALAEGGHDNVTVVVIPVGPGGVPPRPDEPHQLRKE